MSSTSAILDNSLIENVLGVPPATCVKITPDEANRILMSDIHKYGGGIEICQAISSGKDFHLFGRLVSVKY